MPNDSNNTETQENQRNVVGKIEVYVFHFALLLPIHPLNTHILCLLVQSMNGKKYYCSTDDLAVLEFNGTLSIEKSCLHSANQQFIEIQGNIHEIARDIKKYEDEHPYNFCTENCGDEVEWFLEKYADIPNASSCSKPVTCNIATCCICLPSFFQPCTLPGRVMDNVQYKIEKNKHNPTCNMT
jgi:hypothetical protein